MPVAFVIGGAECVWDDVERAHEIVTPDAYFVTNDTIPVWPIRIDFAVTLHPEKLKKWIAERRSNRGNLNFTTYSYIRHELVDYTLEDWAGSVGMFGINAALHEGFQWIILCGVPLDMASGHIVRKIRWTDAPMYQNNWRRRLSQIQDFVRSMSGWTKSLLGEPTQEWLNNNVGAPNRRKDG